MLPSLRDAWSVSGAKQPAPGLRASKFEGGSDLVLASVNADGRRGLLVRANAEDRLQETVDAVTRESGALSAEIYPYFADGRSSRGIHIWCLHSELHDAFGSFCDSLIPRIIAGDNIHAAFVECLEDFRSLVVGADADGNASGLIGLVGELIVLKELSQLGAEACAMWAYPLRDRHDFRNGEAALEVKTSLRSNNGRPLITISAIDQLTAPPHGVLFLHWIRLERDPVGDMSVNRLVESVAAQLAPEQAALLRKRVWGSAPSSNHTERFSVQERKAFLVESGFPRLTPDRLVSGLLDAGVGRVRYEVDLSGAGRFARSVADVNAMFMAARLSA